MDTTMCSQRFSHNLLFFKELIKFILYFFKTAGGYEKVFRNPYD